MSGWTDMSLGLTHEEINKKDQIIGVIFYKSIGVL